MQMHYHPSFPSTALIRLIVHVKCNGILCLLQLGFKISACQGGLTIDKNARKVYRDGQAVELNVKEYELLLLLAENPGRTLHKEYLFDRIWGMDSFSENQTLTVHIRMLRNKIEENPRAPRRIQTVWGVGYRYEEI